MATCSCHMAALIRGYQIYKEVWEPNIWNEDILSLGKIARNVIIAIVNHFIIVIKFFLTTTISNSQHLGNGSHVVNQY